MKKIISALLVLCLLISTSGISILAEDIGFGDSYDFVDDLLNDAVERKFDPSYAVAYNDFESVLNYVSVGGFTIQETDSPAHGKAYKIPAANWAAQEGTSVTATYNWNGATHNMFREPLTKGENYIFSYEYWSEPNPQAPEDKVVNKSTIFSMAPMHDQFKLSTDYRYYPQYYDDDEWHLDTFAFTAGNSQNTTEDEYLNLKFNTCGSYVSSYVDNYLIVKAGEIIINDKFNSVSLEPISDDIIVATDGKAYNSKTTFPLGNTVSFKLKTPSSAIIIKSVKMGDYVISADADGVYTMRATDDIVIDVELDADRITNKYFIDSENNIYFEDKITTVSFANSVDLPIDLLAATRNDAVISKDIYLSANDKLTIVPDVTYNIKYIGDVANGGNGVWSVSDILETISFILNDHVGSANMIAYDINKSNAVTVSDVVLLRKKILSHQEPLSAEPQVISEMCSYVEDTLERSGTEATIQNIQAGIYNYGDRTRIANVIRKAMRGEDIKIIYFGGSITHMGAHKENAPFQNDISESEGYLGWVTDWFRKHFSDINVEVFNAGIGSTDTPLAIHRMVEDVLEREPDLVVNEWSMNDGPTLTKKQGTYEAVVKRLLQNDIAVLLYAFAGGDGITAEELHKPIADHYEVPLISMKSAFFGLTNYSKLTNDNVHPNKVGHALTGISMAYYLQNVYENIAEIGEEPLAIPSLYYHHEAHYYEGAHMADLYDIYNGEVEGIKITSMGSFTWDQKPSGFGNDNYRSYIGASATYSESYEPMVIEIDSAKTLFILNKVSEGFSDGAYYIEVNGKKMTNSEYNCSKGKKEDKNPESGYHWPTPLIRYDPDASAVTLKIYPDIKDVSDANNRVTIYSLLLS